MLYKTLPLINLRKVRLPSCLKTLNGIHFPILLITESATCQNDTEKRGWCDVKVEILSLLEDIRGYEADASKKCNSSICMDSFLVNILFKAECLASPIISAEAARTTNNRVSINGSVVLVALIDLAPSFLWSSSQNKFL